MEESKDDIVIYSRQQTSPLIDITTVARRFPSIHVLWEFCSNEILREMRKMQTHSAVVARIYTALSNRFVAPEDALDPTEFYRTFFMVWNQRVRDFAQCMNVLEHPNNVNMLAESVIRLWAGICAISADIQSTMGIWEPMNVNTFFQRLHRLGIMDLLNHP